MAASSKIEIVLSAITRGFEERLRAATSAVKGFSQGAQQAGAGLSAARRGVESISQSLGRMQSIAAGAFAAGGAQNFVGSFVAAADAMSNLDQRLLLTAKNTNDYAAAQKTVVDVARASHQGLDEVGTLYSRMALATANLNVSQQELADVTRTVALATALSGSSASEASAGLQQFAQAMASNRLGGDELRSVLESMPLLTKVFVNAAGGSIATLREMAEKGELTTTWMFEAIKNAKDEIEAQAKAMPMTVGRAMTDLGNEFSMYVSKVDQATGATDIMAASVQWLGQNLDMVAKAGVMALSAALSVLIGRGIAAATASIASFVTGLGAVATAATTSGAAVSSAAAYMTGSYAPAVSTVAVSTTSRLIPALLGLVNPITAITAVLGIGAAAWALWGRSAESELDKAKGRVAELQRTNQMLKELSDPGIRLQATTANIESARAEVARLEKELADVSSGPVDAPFDDSIGRIATQLDQAQQKLKTYEQEHVETQKNIAITTEQRGVKEIAVEMSVTDAIKKQDEERRKVTASKLENDLAEIETKRQAELKVISPTYSADDKQRVEKAINARFAAAAAKAREDADEKSAKKAETAARKADSEAKRRERERLKAAKLEDKIDTEKLRAQSEATILELERKKLEADNSGSELERAEKLLEINRQISAEQIKLQEAEAKLIEADPSKTEADVIKAKSEITKAQLAALRQEHSDLADIASYSLAEVEEAWRLGAVSVDQYTAALESARNAGILTDKQLRERKIASGDDMGAAFSLGLEKAKLKMQSDGEMMIYIGENIGDQIAGGLTSAWDSFITGTASAKEALIDFARSTISWLSQVILKQMLLNALQSVTGGSGNGSGSFIAGLASAAASSYGDGGMVTGWSPNSKADNINAWLTAREFVQPVRAVDYYGVSFMERIRRLQFPRHIAHALAGGTIPRVPSGHRLADGGMAAAGQTTVKGGDTKLKVVNVLDSNMVGDYMRTAAGETTILNMIRRNGSTIRTMLGG